MINFFTRFFSLSHSGCGKFENWSVKDLSRKNPEESRRVRLARQRIRILAEINHLKTLNYDTCQRLTQIESRWVKTSDSLSRRGVSFIREARRILEAIEKRHQNLTMLLELGDDQIQIASKIIDAPMKIETEYCVGTKPELTCVSVATKELPAVVNVIVNCLEQETESLKDTQILKRQSLSLA